MLNSIEHFSQEKGLFTFYKEQEQKQSQLFRMKFRSSSMGTNLPDYSDQINQAKASRGTYVHCSKNKRINTLINANKLHTMNLKHQNKQFIIDPLRTQEDQTHNDDQGLIIDKFLENCTTVVKRKRSNYIVKLENEKADQEPPNQEKLKSENQLANRNIEKNMRNIQYGNSQTSKEYKGELEKNCSVLKYQAFTPLVNKLSVKLIQNDSFKLDLHNKKSVIDSHFGSKNDKKMKKSVTERNINTKLTLPQIPQTIISLKRKNIKNKKYRKQSKKTLPFLSLIKLEKQTNDMHLPKQISQIHLNYFLPQETIANWKRKKEHIYSKALKNIR